MARRFLVLAGLVYALVLLGLLMVNPGMIALALPLVVYLASTLLSRPPHIAVHGERKLSADTVPQGTPVEITVRVTNDGVDLDEALVEDRLPEGLELVDGKTSVLTTLPKGASVELKYTVRAMRGKFFFQDIMVSGSDHLGVLRDRVLVPARARVLFLPQTIQLKRVLIRPNRTHGHFGPIPSRQAGSGVDFYGLREYQMGDPLRWINWRTSARHDQQLFVNQYEQERIADVGIILDARQQSDIVLDNGQALFEYGVQAAGSLSDALLTDGNKVGLLVYGFGMDRVFPGYGKVQQERILYMLGQAKTGHNFALESLAYLPTRFFPAGSQIVMVSPLVSSDVPAFTRLRATGYEVLLVSPDPVDFEARGLHVKGDVGWKIARVERALMLRKLQRMGVRVLDWQVDRPLEPLVRSTLGRITPAMHMGASTGGGRGL